MHEGAACFQKSRMWVYHPSFTDNHPCPTVVSSKDVFKSKPLVPVNIILFENRVFADWSR